MGSGKNVLFVIAAMVSLYAASVVPSLAQPYKSVRDWYVSCTYSLTCQLYTSNPEEKIWSFGFERGPKASAPITFSFSTGLDVKPESSLAILIDGKDLHHLDFPRAVEEEGTWKFPGQDADGELREVMRTGRKMIMKVVTTEGPKKVEISLSGVTGSMLFADEAQGRVGNKDALEARGEGEPVDAVTRARELTAADQLPEAVRTYWQNMPDQCSEGMEDDDIMAVMGANAIGNLPITIGGSGLAEFGIIAYLNNLDPFAFEITEGVVGWDAVIGWRIATYYIPIIITWLLLVKLALSKIPKSQSS